MPFRESSPIPLRTTCRQHSQKEMRHLSNCLKSFQTKQWLIWCLWLIVLPLLALFLPHTLPESFSDPSLYSSLLSVLFLLETLGASIFLTHTLPPGWDAGAPCHCSAGPDHRLSNVKPSPLLVHGHTLLENTLKLCPNTKDFRCL